MSELFLTEPDVVLHKPTGSGHLKGDGGRHQLVDQLYESMRYEKLKQLFILRMHMPMRSLIFFICAATALSMVWAPIAWSRRITVYVATQRGHYFGEQVAYVTPTCLRLETKRTGSVFLWKSSNKIMQVVNNTKKVYYEASAKQVFQQDLLGFSSSLKDIQGKPSWVAGETTRICGVAARKYLPQSSMDDLLMRDVRIMATYWVARDIPLPEAGCELLSQNVVPIDRLPLRVVSRIKIVQDEDCHYSRYHQAGENNGG